VILLVALRLNIGWHFFSEGVKHYTDPTWTSEGTLRGATGPLAPLYKSYLPDFHGMDEWLHADRPEKEADVAKGWVGQVESDLENRRQAFALHYGLNDKQQEKSLAITRDFQALVRSWANGRQEELANHAHQWRRQHGNSQAADAAEVPFRKQRISGGQAALSAEAAGWRTELIALEMEHEAALGEVLTADQRAQGPRPRADLDQPGRCDDDLCYHGGGRAAAVGFVYPHGVRRRRPVFDVRRLDAALLGFRGTSYVQSTGRDVRPLDPGHHARGALGRTRLLRPSFHHGAHSRDERQ